MYAGSKIMLDLTNFHADNNWPLGNIWKQDHFYFFGACCLSHKSGRNRVFLLLTKFVHSSTRTVYIFLQKTGYYLSAAHLSGSGPTLKAGLPTNPLSGVVLAVVNFGSSWIIIHRIYSFRISVAMIDVCNRAFLVYSAIKFKDFSTIYHSYAIVFVYRFAMLNRQAS